MKNLQEEINKINRMIKSLNEQPYETRGFDEYEDEDDTRRDGERDEYVEKAFMNCMSEIKKIFGGNLERREYILMVDKYLKAESELDDTEGYDLPF